MPAEELPGRAPVGDREGVELSVFEEVGEALRGLAPPELGAYRQRAHKYGVKVWFGAATPPREHYEAASIDGAGAFQRFLFITLPHLRYLLVVATTLDVINTVRTFDIVAVMTRGGPVNATEILPVLIFNTAFQANRFGPAAAAGILLLLLLLVFSTVYILLLQPERAGARPR